MHSEIYKYVHINIMENVSYFIAAVTKKKISKKH